MTKINFIKIKGRHYQETNYYMLW